MTVSLLRFASPRGLRITKAEGQYVWDSSGRRYLDFYMGYGAAFLGHRHPKVVKALSEQLGSYMTVTPAFDTEALDRCLEKLGQVLPPHLTKVFFLNSGSEAVELALKISRKLTGRKKVLAFNNGFHGRTMAALSVTWNSKYREGFEPYPFEAVFLPFNDAETVDRRLNEEFAAVIFEPVQGEGGIIPATTDFMKAVEKRAKEVGAFVVVDEIQSGFGRTGVVWAHERAGIMPDMLTAAKAVAGGFPASFVAVTEEVASKVKETDHGSTYGGNSLALAAITAATEVLMEENVPQQAEEKGNALGEALKPVVEENTNLFRAFRRVGLMVGIEMRTQPMQFIKGLQSNGLIGFKAGLTVLRFLPPYVINERDVAFAAETLRKTARELSGLREKGAENL
ncbi:MAG: aspartate aminotransferase family protein [Candidatus Caldarchaeum sp.]|nr:aspartate aminotransferase family protein [Candidatus Caldarchaeum sp.]